MLGSLIALSAAPAARADKISEEVAAGRIGPSGDGSTSFFRDRLGAAFEPNEELTWRLKATYNRYGSTPTDSAADFWLFGLGATFEASRHVALSLDISASPRSSQTSHTSLSVNPTRFGSDAATVAVRTRSSTYGALASLEYDTARSDDEDEHDVEGVFELSSGVSRYDLAQAIPEVSLANGERLTHADLEASCAAERCGRRILDLLRHEKAGLYQASFGAGATITLFDSTDIELFGTYYVYTRDPLQVGYFSRAFSRTPLGEGLPTAPLQFSIGPALVERFGRFSLEASFWYGAYVSQTGSADVFGARGTFDVTKSWRVWLGGNLERSGQTDSAAYWTGWVSLGGRYRF